jgi:undecaprenyl-diphosphatase
MSQTKTDKSWRNRLARPSISHRPGYRLFVVSVTMFLLMAVLVATRTMWIVSLDLSVQDELLELRSPWLNETMVWITRLGSRWVIGSLLLLLTAWVVRTGRCRKALMVMIVAFLANPVLEYALKAIVDRPRPDLASLVPGNGPSFPSGHVLATVGFYGVLATVLWLSSSRMSVRLYGSFVAAFVILGVGFSRVYLDVHWSSDVVAGLFAGTAFVVIVAWSLRGHHFGGGLGCGLHDLPHGDDVAFASASS